MHRHPPGAEGAIAADDLRPELQGWGLSTAQGGANPDFVIKPGRPQIFQLQAHHRAEKTRGRQLFGIEAEAAMRFEAVFPRPRAVFQLAENYRVYVSGQLAGGSWSIERAFTFDDDLATYRDLRVCIGLEHNEKAGHWSAIEAGYLFNRRLEYSSGLGNTALPDAAIIRLVTRY